MTLPRRRTSLLLCKTAHFCALGSTDRTENLTMATLPIPVLEHTWDCSDFSKTVAPYAHQFYELPGRLVASINSIEALQRLYVETNPLITGFSASLLVGAIALVASEINRNYSQIDRLWSILPNLYIVHLAAWARLAGVPHARIDLVAAFSTLWSVSWCNSDIRRSVPDGRWCC